MIIKMWKDLGSAGQRRSSLLVALAILLVCIFITETLPQMILDLRQQMNLTNEQANLIRFLPATAGLLIVPSAGHITDQFGAKRVLSLSLTSICIGSLVIAISNYIDTLIFGLMLIGLGQMASIVTAYSLLTKAAGNSKQLALFIVTWGITENIGFLIFPPIGSWILVHSLRGWSNISLLWTACCFSLLIINQWKRKQPLSSKDEREHQILPVESKGSAALRWLAVTGVIFSLTTAIPIVDVLNPAFTGLLIMIDAAAVALLCSMVTRCKQAQSDLQFMKNPAIVLALLALAATYLVDWYYFSERFISTRYLMNLNQTSTWLTPANLSGLIGVSLFGSINLKLGLRKSTTTVLAVWLLMPMVFAFTSIATPVWMIAASIAVFTMLEAMVFTGLQSSATAMVAKSSLGMFGSMMNGLNMMTKSIGSALTSDVMITTYKDSLNTHLQPLPLSDTKTALILKWLTEGKRHLVLEGDYSIPSNLIKNYLARESTPHIDSVVKCLHVLGYLCLGMGIITCALYAASLITKPRLIAQQNS